MFAKFRLIVILALPILFLSATSLRAQQPVHDLLLILDASNSMWAQIGGEPKIAIAKRVLADLVGGLKDRSDLAVGIRVYGHQTPYQGKDCTDTRLEMGFAAPDPDKTRELINRITAKGQTPIAYSLTRAKNDFDLAADRKRTIVLITDGVESCGGDPCAAARELAEQGIDVVMHVVGFDLGQEEMDALACLVEPSGGLLLPAADAEQLKNALDEVIKRALSENLAVYGQDSNADPLQVWVEVFRPGEQKSSAAKGGERTGFLLEPGTYDVIARHPPTKQEQRFEALALTEDELTEITAVFGVARLGAVAADCQGRPVDTWLKIYRVENGQAVEVASGWAGKDQAKMYDLVPGTYRLVLREPDTDQAVEFEDVTLGPGQSLVLETSFAKAWLGAKAADSEGNRLVPYIHIFRVENGQETKVASGWAGDKKPKMYPLAPGVYNLVIKENDTGQEVVFENIELGPDNAVVKEASFDRCELQFLAVDSQGSPVRTYLNVYRVENGREKGVLGGWNNADKPRVIILAPGTYKAVVKTGDGKQQIVVEDIVLGPGERQVRQVRLAPVE